MDRNPGAHIKLDAVVQVYHSGIPVARWEAEIWETLDIHKPAGLVYGTGNKKRRSNQVEVDYQHLELSSDLYMFDMACVLASQTHTHTHTLYFI